VVGPPFVDENDDKVSKGNNLFYDPSPFQSHRRPLAILLHTFFRRDNCVALLRLRETGSRQKIILCWAAAASGNTHRSRQQNWIEETVKQTQGTFRYFV
jgi:hypothetical protein